MDALDLSVEEIRAALYQAWLHMDVYGKCVITVSPTGGVQCILPADWDKVRERLGEC
jgi:hypothetical protein